MTFLVPRSKTASRAIAAVRGCRLPVAAVVPPYVRLKKKNSVVSRQEPSSLPRQSQSCVICDWKSIGKCLKENQIGRLIFYLRLGVMIIGVLMDWYWARPKQEKH